MSDKAYEKEVLDNLSNNRNLILLGVRADSDIAFLKKKIKRLEGKIKSLEEIISWKNEHG